MNRYSTESLQADIDHGGYGITTHPRQARELLKLDTPERRQRAMSEAQTRQNIRGGVLSSCLFAAVADLLANIAADEEARELYGERVARTAREREAELRKTQPGAIYTPPELRRP